MARFFLGTATLITLFCVGTVHAGLNIQYDYTYDTNGFFDDPARRDALELAGRLVNRYVDDLEPIVPPGGEIGWSTFLTRPDNSNFLILNSETIPEDTIVIYAGGRSLPCCLAQAEEMNIVPVGGDEDWAATVQFRGESGAADTPASDYGAAGGMLSFSEEVNWHFGMQTRGLAPNEFDFVTVAMHELLHILGVGTSKSFSDQINNVGQFIGPESVAVGSLSGEPLQLDPIEGHWESGTRSSWDGVEQEALLAPGIFPGSRAMPTLLDRAVLRDIGWEEAQPGDANLDRSFDTRDIITVFQAGLYESGFFAGWSDGDWNDDGRFESNDLIAGLQTGTFEQNNAVAAQADGGIVETTVRVTYNEQTGDVEVDTDGLLTTFQIESFSSLLRPDTSGDGGLFEVDRSDKRFVLDMAGFDQLLFEAALPTSLQVSDLLNDLTFDGSWFEGGGIEDVDLRVVPEPTHAMAFLMAFSLFVERFRRRSR